MILIGKPRAAVTEVHRSAMEVVDIGETYEETCGSDLMLSMFTTSLLVAPIVTEASAATSSQHMSKHMKKKKLRVTHQSPKAAIPMPAPFSRYEDDPGRRAGGGGGGY